MAKKPIIIDNNDRNADWIKTLSWDLPTDPETLARMFGDDWYARLSRLPAWDAAPANLKAMGKSVGPFAAWFGSDTR